MKKIIILTFWGLFALFTQAQPICGTTGLLNIPSAEMQQDGTFMAGANFLPDKMTSTVFDYNTGNYFINLTFLPFMEFSYRMTLLKVITGKFNQDRSFGLRLRLLRERTYLPAFVIGGNDIFSTSGQEATYFNFIYGVVTKNLKLGESTLGLTTGFAHEGWGGLKDGNMKGIFGGVSFSPGILPPLRLMAEFDSHAYNIGSSMLLFKHFFLYGMLHDMKNPAGGFAVFIFL